MTQRPAKRAGAVCGFVRFICRPLSRTRILFSSMASGLLSACSRQTTTQAIDATSNRRAMAGPLSCCHCSNCWPWLLSNLKKLSIRHLQ